ncbi:hypothetical protein J7T55_001357 [Diaporthe amygdali]|uniref:uncharacterized protein n=1 Tax=Phomopsis amygdali TaxID=1214568 RepID=UPI0022FE640C|nr:uncharacterized protein J7T55_001357 [Diaporthe amygdali]KAJ0106833.1 hypothetical protein J7T55_001357 [Diaporthe amygdali]
MQDPFRLQMSCRHTMKTVGVQRGTARSHRGYTKCCDRHQHVCRVGWVTFCHPNPSGPIRLSTPSDDGWHVPRSHPTTPRGLRFEWGHIVEANPSAFVDSSPDFRADCRRGGNNAKGEPEDFCITANLHLTSDESSRRGCATA